MVVSKTEMCHAENVQVMQAFDGKEVFHIFS